MTTDLSTAPRARHRGGAASLVGAAPSPDLTRGDFWRAVLHTLAATLGR